ncbi:hypothetical protein HUU59_08185 [bacterium]|nr:hypothetical protein [bacterium]
MAQNHEQLTKTRTTQIWVGLAATVVFISLISGHLATLRDRSLVASAIQDANQFRRALAAFEVDYGQFPQDTVWNPHELVQGLRDPDGKPYLRLTSETEITGFTYMPDADGQGYTIVLHARDRKNTPVVASPSSTTADDEG